MAFTDTELTALQEQMTASTERAIRNVLEDEHALQGFASSLVNAVQAIAREKTGGVVLGAIGGLFSKLALFVMLAGIVYVLGGWAAIPKLWALLGEKGS